MPDQHWIHMDEFLFEFENDVDPQDAANNDQGLKLQQVACKYYQSNED